MKIRCRRWQTVWKINSITTPYKLAFDASQTIASSYSLNDALSKNRNNMNKLVEVVIRWFTNRNAFHTDVQKMFNSVKVREEDWCF